MRMHRWLFPAMLTLASCTPKESSTDASDGEADADTDADSDSDSDADTDTTPTSEYGLDARPVNTSCVAPNPPLPRQ